MLILPAIDIERGRVARGSRGISGDPVAEARALLAAGVSWIHVVDMDRVFGRGDNTLLVRRMAELDGVHLQLGGGLGDPDAIGEALAWGIDRVVIGASAVATTLHELAAAFGPDRLAAGIDVRDGRVTIRTGGQSPNATPTELVDLAVAAGVRTVVYRDLARDGQLDGADLDGATALVGRGASVVLAGGIASLDELRQADAMGIGAVLVGRAIHEGSFSLEEAMACLA